MEVFNLLAKLVLDDKEYNKALEAAEKNGEDFSINLKDILKGAGEVLVSAGIVKGIQKISSAFSGAMKKTFEHADAIDKQSQALGISAKAYQELDYALGLNGASISNLTRGVSNLNAIMSGTAAKSITEAFDTLGVDTEDANGNIRDTSDVLQDVISAIARMDQTAERSNIIDTLFGKGQGKVLNAFFNAGEQGIQNLMKEANELGLVMSDDAIKQAAATNDSMDKLQQALDSLVYKFMEPLLPIVSDILDWLMPIVTDLMPIISTLGGWVRDLVHFLTGKSSEGEIETITGKAYKTLGKTVLRSPTNITNAEENELLDAYIESSEKGYEELENKLRTMMLQHGYSGGNVDQVINELRGTEYDSAAFTELLDRLGQIEELYKKAQENANNAVDDIDAVGEEANAVSGDYPINFPVSTGEIPTPPYEGLHRRRPRNVTGTADPSLMNGKYNDGSNAAGMWNVPYDGYTAVLHRNEAVLNASRADDYRNGEGSVASSRAIVGAIQRLENTLANLRLMVGEKEFGRATTEYGGRRMNNYIGAADGRIAAGYGS